MPRVPCLTRLNGGPWGLRRRVPDELRSIIGKREIWKSYGADSFAKAKLRHSREMAAVDAEFAKARLTLARQRAGEPVQQVAKRVIAVATEEDIRTVALAWFHKRDRKSEAEDLADLNPQPGLTADALPPDPDEMRVTLADDEADLAGPHGLHWGEKLARDALAEHGLRLPGGDLEALAARLFQRGAIEATHRSRQRWEGMAAVTPRDPIFSTVTSASPPPPVSPHQGLTFAALCSAYLAAPERTGLAPKTKLKYQGMVRVFCDLLGADKRASTVTREDCRRAQAELLALPANAAQRYPGMSCKRAIEAAKRDGAPTLHPKSVGNYLGFLASVYGWAIREQLLSSSVGNPAAGLNAATPKAVRSGKSREKPRPFTQTELRAIFSAPLYTGCEDDERGYNCPGDNRPRRGRFWVPLICLFTGMRLNEACQLQVADIIEVDGTHLFLVTVENDEDDDGGNGKSLKTESSKRRVPVHSELIRIGFLDHVAMQRDAGRSEVFPELPRGKHGNHSDPFSKWFARFRKQQGVTSRRAVFHSFRHTFRDRLRESEIPREIAEALSGWSDRRVSSEYGEGFSARKLSDHMNRISYPGLDLSHLYQNDEED